jgi:hypothetical protein
MSGKHRRPEPDALPDVDVAERLRAGTVVEVPSTVVSGPTVVARRSRTAERKQRRRSSRRRVSLIAGAVVLLLLVVLGGWWLTGHRSTGSPSVKGTVNNQRTLLVQLAAPDGTAAASALLGVRIDQTQAVGILIPSRLIVDSAGSGAGPFGETLALPDRAAPAKALTDLLGVTIQGSWVLTPAGMAGLVDAVGGIQAAVDVDITTKNAKGVETVVVRPGSQRLAGAAAAAYAGFAAPGEPEQARLARYNDVLRGVMQGLPDKADDLTALLARLGKGSQSTLARPALVDLLQRAHRAATAGKLVPDVLPVNSIDSGGAEEAYGLNGAQAAALMKTDFGPSLIQGGPGAATRVYVQNGVGTPGLVDKARTRLVAQGFRFVNGGNAPQFGVKKTIIYIAADSTQPSQQRGARVAAALGVPAASVIGTQQGQTVADVIVILGSDFRG